ncbi:MAG TPA: GNAT family N-acetyltransferase [Actinomycetota bacterium]|nr:GNAT family N-acetyltransferase [Actinomycetota bacterium]
MSDAWALANDAAATAGVRLAPLRTVDDADAIGDVIVATWGEQPIGPEVVRALAESGNEPYGAFDGGELVAFVLGWAGVDADGLHIHSHMLAARPDRRHAGVGYALKLAQRAQALDHGIHTVRWTFDPLIARNAYFNLAKLGAVADRFERAFYGEMADELNRGDRTDRLTARWNLDAEPGPRRSPAAATLLHRNANGPAFAGAPADADAVAIEVPAEYLELRTTAPEVAARWRDAVAQAAETCIARGLVAVAFDRQRSAYVFATEAP